MFLDALTYVQAGDAEGFKTALKALLDKYPSEDVSELAGEMLKGVLRGRQMVQGGVTGMTWNLRFGTGDDGSLSAADSARTFKAEPNVPYRMVMIYPTGLIDRNQLLFTVAAYNFANFMVKQLDMSFEESGIASIFVLSGFYNFDEAWHYYKMIYGQGGYASNLDKAIDILPISEDNYETLMHGKTLDEYVAFFDEHFHDKAPELAARWAARKEAQAEEAEKKANESSETTPADSLTVPADSVSSRQHVPESPVPAEKKQPVPEVEKPSVLDSTVVTVPDTSVILPDDTVQPVLEEQPLPEKGKPDFTAPKPEKDKGLTLEDIEKIRRLQAEAEEMQKEEARRVFEAEQEAEQERLLKAKEERERKLEADRKAKLKQAEADRKAKLKAREELRKEKERAYKERLKQREKERKEKERAYKQKLKEREKARKAELKAREEARKNREKSKE